jgi:hypothetical protein
MTRPAPIKAPPIAYNIQGAADAIGQGVDVIRDAIRRGDLTPRYPNSRALIGHADLLEWFDNLPVDKPSEGRS